MEEDKNKSGQPFKENESDRSQGNQDSGASYYYSYGPFQSYSREPEGTSTSSYSGSEGPSQDVEITRPQPVKPLPNTYGYRSSTEDAGALNGGGGGSLPPKNSGNWQFNKPKKKSSAKSIIAAFLAGMLIMGGGMAFADYAHLFTGNRSEPTVAEQNMNQGSNDTTASKASTTSYPVAGSTDVAGVVKEAGPAVVKIETLVKAGKQSNRSNSYSDDPFYRFFFGDDSNNGGYGNGNSDGGGSSSNSNQLVPTGIGSGFIFDKSGYILTNEHVVHNADVVQVTVQNTEKPYEAKVLGKSYELDLAVLKIEGNNDFPSIPLGSSDNSQVGDWLVAIGNPKGFDHTVTTGVLSAKERSITIAGENGEKDREYEHLLQTDASINPGNSGGPLLNLNGEVVGINVAVSADSQGIGFAIPTSTVKEVIEKLKNNEKIPEKPVPFIGATLMTMSDEVAAQMGSDVKEGSVVSSVVFKSPAYNADLRPYDIITGADGKKFATKESLIEYIQKQNVGDEVTFNIVRDGNKMDLKIKIGNKNDFSNVQ
ncbi:S1C family serine protease [Paenibacillus motobuensis]|uniref:Trypsin-like peptidase domain-containing protein n=1 Tax=Paenibacillus motobuensis TaxID=295324 RepID=A0ABP3HZU7_9BACL